MWSNEQIANGFNAFYSTQARSPTYRSIFREVYGNEYPEELATFSYLTATELDRSARALSASTRIVDLGCGCGGATLWFAMNAAATVLGIDLSEVAIAEAGRRAREAGLEGRATFQVGSVLRTGFPNSHFDGAFSVDALWLVPQEQALKEAARVLDSGSRFVFTTWDHDISPPGYPDTVPDHRPLLARAGFAVETYEDPTEKESKRREVYERFVRQADALVAELGKSAAGIIVRDARVFLGLEDGIDYFASTRRVFAVARKS